MSDKVRVSGSAGWGDAFTLDDILDAADARMIPFARQSGRRHRRRNGRTALMQASLLAAVLAAEGCTTVGGDAAAPVGEPAPTPTPTPAPDPAPDEGADDIAVAENAPSSIAVSDILEAYPGAQEIVTITTVTNGTATINGAVVTFTPAAGFEGVATINFTYLDSAGVQRTGVREITVDDDAVGDGHNHGDHDDHTGGDPDHSMHADDPAKMAEHGALMDLVPAGEATHVAAANGSWFDPATWANGQVPGAGARVLIPDGVKVDYDGESPASIFTIRVDGELDFATDRNTFLEVDTLVVAPLGKLTIGTADDPVQANVEAVIQIADNGPIDVAWDPQLLSRGVITTGAVEIHGAQKDSFLRVAEHPMAGDDTITFATAPQGWQVGDRLVITGTHLTEQIIDQTTRVREDTTEDEEIVITAINGNTITFEPDLKYDHEGARDDLMAYVANYTRNIRIETENADSIPDHQRGHVMLMHSDEVDVRYAEFSDLGRTDKSERAFDLDDVATVQSDTNLKGRYSLHIHRTGLSDLDDPVMIVGNSVWGSPGWGYVHHDSNAILTDNASYDVFGGAYVAELGTETGRWSDNISIKTIGVARSPKDGEDVAAFDLARNGVGFWFQGRLVDAVGNVAAGAPGGFGYVYMHRGVGLNLDPDTVPQNDKLRYDQNGNEVDAANINQFDDNEAIAVWNGLVVVKAGPSQGHDVRTVFDGFLAWETFRAAEFEYTGHYSLLDFDLTATDSADIPGLDGTRGLLFGTNTYDMVVFNAKIHGFGQGVTAAKDVTAQMPTDNFEYIYIGVDVTGSLLADMVGVDPTEILPESAIFDRELTYASDLLGTIIPYGYDSSDRNVLGQKDFLDIRGEKTDSLGTALTSPDWDPFKFIGWSMRGALEENGYWKTADGRVVTLAEEYIADRLTGELQKYSLYIEVDTSLFNPEGTIDPNNPNGLRVQPAYHGILDMDSAAPVANNDAATVIAGEKIIIDVLANDSDPEGGDIILDGVFSEYGHVVENDDGTVTYFADPGQSGEDKFTYWVRDEHGVYSKAEVTITVLPPDFG